MPLIKCPECGKEISNQVNKCPNCGFVIKKKHPILSVIWILFVLGIIASVFQEKDKNINQPEQDVGTIKVISDNWCYGEFGTKAVCGVIVNDTSKQYSYVQVAINLYDASGVQIGSALDNVNNLESGGRWKFKIHVMENEAVDYKIKDVFYH